MAIPGVKQARWYWLEWAMEAALVAAALIPLSVNAAEEFQKPPPHFGWWYVAAIVLALTIGIVKVAIEVARCKKRKRKDSPQDLTACLWVLYGTVCRKCGISEEDQQTLRVTIHRLDGEHLEQCVPYIGGDGSGEGRRFSKRSGIIGRAVVTKQPLVGTRTNGDTNKFHDELAQVWHMPADEAKKVSQDRWSWMAVPLRGRSEPPAVVYLDSSRPDFFTNEIQELVVGACQGVAAFIQQRYPEEP